MSTRLCGGFWGVVFTAAVMGAGAGEPDGDAVIRAGSGEQEIVITTTRRLAGAVHSLRWGGKEFIDSVDHGRQLQSASSFDCGLSQPFWAECFNPTEAGSRADGAGPTSTSRLLKLHVGDGELVTETQMAFWLKPGERSAGKPALNKAPLSNHRVAKRIRIGYRDLPQVLDYQVVFTVPDGEHHTYAQFEALTGYMPAEFERFWRFRPETSELEVLEDGPGEQQYPVVLATRSGEHAMGIFSPQQPSPGFASAGYGRFRFASEKVVKWNCVFRVRGPGGITAGEHRYQMFVAVGAVDDVRRALTRLHSWFAK